VAKTVYEAFEGTGYARIDIRQDNNSGKLMVLDINPNCSLFYKDECTADTILRYCEWPKSRFMRLLLDDALNRQSKYLSTNSTVVHWNKEHGFSLLAKRNLSPDDLVYSDEMNAVRIATRDYVNKHWTKNEIATFDKYAWPVGDNTYAIWDSDSSKWKPINHSCDPNCWMSGLDVVARRSIKAGEELTLDYSTFLPSHPEFECWCGSKMCRKNLKPGEYKEQWFKERYYGRCSPYIQAMLEQEHERLQRQKQLDAGPDRYGHQSGLADKTDSSSASPSTIVSLVGGNESGTDVNDVNDADGPVIDQVIIAYHNGKKKKKNMNSSSESDEGDSSGDEQQRKKKENPTWKLDSLLCLYYLLY